MKTSMDQFNIKEKEKKLCKEVNTRQLVKNRNKKQLMKVLLLKMPMTFWLEVEAEIPHLTILIQTVLKAIKIMSRV